MFRRVFYFYSQETRLDINLPVNIGRMIEAAKIEMSQKNKLYSREHSKTNPIVVYQKVLQLFKELEAYTVARGLDK